MLDEFGFSVAISGSTAIVGAPLDIDNGSVTGSAYIYQFDGNAWQETKITPSDGVGNEQFGYSVAISGSTAIVGAVLDDDNGPSSGSAYIYQFDGNAWQETKITPSDGVGNDQFGYSVAISGNTAIVGAIFDDDNGTSSGSAYIYQFDGNAWQETKKISASDAAASDFFGVSVAISGSEAIVGASFDDDNGSGSGSAYIYNFGTVLNLETNELTSDLSRAVSSAWAYDRLAVLNGAFNVDGIISFSQKPLTFIGVEDITTASSLMLVPASGTVFDNSSDIANTSQFAIGGDLIAPNSGTLFFSNLNLSTGGGLLQNSAQLIVQDSMVNDAGTAILSGEIFASDVQTNASGTNLVARDTDVYCDYINNGTTKIHRGVLYIYGSLTNNGTLLGTVDTGPGVRGGGDEPVAGDGMSISEDYTIGTEAALRMIDFGWTLSVGGNLDCAINDNTRFNMIDATIAMSGLGSNSQTLELMSADLGATIDGLDPLVAGNYPVGTIVVRTGTTVTLVDQRDNANDGQGTCEALYVENLLVQAGGTLITNGCPVYAMNSTIDGVVNGEIEPIGANTCSGDIFGNDGLVNIHDLLSLIAAWGTNDPTADINTDGIVNIHDLLVMIGDWGVCP